MEQGTETTHYEVLGVSEDATTEEIDRAYRTLIRDLHPDGKPESYKATFTQMSQQANHARDILTNPDERAKYDLILQQARQWQEEGSEESEDEEFVVDDEAPEEEAYSEDAPPDSSSETQPAAVAQVMKRVEGFLSHFPPIANALLAVVLSSFLWVLVVLATIAAEALLIGIVLVLLVPLLSLPIWIAAGKLRAIRDQIADGAGMANKLMLVEQLRRNPVTGAVVDIAVSAENRFGVPVTATHRAARAIALGPLMAFIAAIPLFNAVYGVVLLAALAWALAWIAIFVNRRRRAEEIKP